MKNSIVIFFICSLFLTEEAFGVPPLVCPDTVTTPEGCIGYYTSEARLSSLYRFARAKRHLGYMRECKYRYAHNHDKSYFSGDTDYFKDVMQDIQSIYCPSQPTNGRFTCIATTTHSSCYVSGSGRYKNAVRSKNIKFVLAQGSLDPRDKKFYILTAFPWMP